LRLATNNRSDRRTSFKKTIKFSCWCSHNTNARKNTNNGVKTEFGVLEKEKQIEEKVNTLCAEECYDEILQGEFCLHSIPNNQKRG